MRDPVRLWRELGPRRFWGVQATFLGTLSQFALAPVLWSFWLLPLGLPHPSRRAPRTPLVWGARRALPRQRGPRTSPPARSASRQPSHRWLIPWVPTLHLYFPLGALAAWKGLVELVVRPFFWDKTEHGLGVPDRPTVAVRRIPAPPRAGLAVEGGRRRPSLAAR